MDKKEIAWNNALGREKQFNKYGIPTQKYDRAEKLMQWSEYGNRNSHLGWNIHHKDGNKKNNNPSNLEAVNYKTHDNINKF